MKKKECPTCKQDMHFIPGGISKGNKPYDAFWGCTKECNTTLPIPKEEGRRMSFEFQMAKDKQIAYFNSTNAAVEMVKVMYPNLVKEGKLEEIPTLLRQHREWFLNEWKEFYMKEIINEED